jgi:hypothetical protein
MIARTGTFASTRGMLHPLAALTCLFAVLCATTGVTMAQAGPEAPVNLTVGGRTLLVPLPDGHVRCDGIDPDWDRAIESMLPAGNRLLANFGSAADQAGLRDGETISFARSFNVQILRSLEKVEVNERMFDEMRVANRKELEALKSTIQAQVNKTLEAGNRQMSEELGVDLQLSVGDMAMLGIFEDTATSLGFTMAMTATVQGPDGDEKSRHVVAAVLVPVNGRLLYLYSNAEFKDDADRQAVESSVLAWRDAIVAANPRVEGSFLGSLTKGVGKSAMTGAIAGGIVALLAVLYRRFKR